MKKKNNKEVLTSVAAEPATAFKRLDPVTHTPVRPTKRGIPADCMTVDEYFDGLIAEIHKEYARLRGDFQ